MHSVRVKDVCNEFLTAKETLVDTGELSRRHFKDLRCATDTIVDHFGGNRQAEDILSAEFAELRRKLAKRYGPAGLTRTIANVRQVFNFAKANHLIEDVHFGSEFKGPSRKVKRLHAAKNGVKLFEPQEVLDLLESASPSMRAIILLGVNCGLGNADVATLQRRYVDLDSGWISYHRPKTGVYR